MNRSWIVKRVPADFSWPTGEVWHGYVNPWPGPVACVECSGTGLSRECKKLFDSFRSWAPKLTQAEAAQLMAAGVSPREVDRLRRRIYAADTPVLRCLLVEIRAKRKGIWASCEVCDGNQMVSNPNPAVVRLYEGVNLFDEWEPIEPPTGTGWQLWENPAPEGYPCSPVFETPEALAEWCQDQFRSSYDGWLRWIRHEGQNLDREEPMQSFRLQSDHMRVFSTPAQKKSKSEPH